MTEFPKLQINLNTIYPWGKWKGIQVGNMIDPVKNRRYLKDRGDGFDYIKWIMRECPNITLSNDVLDEVNRIEAAKKKKKNKKTGIAKPMKTRTFRPSKDWDTPYISGAYSDDLSMEVWGMGPFPY